MNQELILEAVKAVIEFNNIEDLKLNCCASIEISKHSAWLSIIVFNDNSGHYIYNKREASNETLKEFINKLKELGEK